MNRQSVCGALLLTASISPVAMLSAPVYAAAPDVAGVADSAELQEIVVTAQRQAQNVLSVPLSISAMSGDELAASGIRDFTDLEYTTPGFFGAEGAGYSNLFIRGIGNNINIGADPSVAVFVDDVPRLYGQLFNKLTDVERVEVLKGAQGGLYGRNATGGVINVITREPSTDKFGGNALVDYGEMNTFRAAGYVNLPVNDVLAISLAGERDSHDAYLRNVATNPSPYTAAMFPGGSPLGTGQQTANALNSFVHLPSGVDTQRLWSMDGKVLFKPVDIFKITLAYDYSDKADTKGDDFFQQAPAYMLGLVQNGYLPGFGVNAQLPSSLAVGTQGKFTVAMPIAPKQKIRDYGESATAVLNLSGVDLTSITAYRTNDAVYFTDVNDLPIPVLDPLTESNKWFFYQELRVASTGSGPFHYLGGATFLDDHQSNASIFSEFPPLLLDLPLAKSTDIVHNWSVYAQAGYDPTQALNVTISGRYVHETNANRYIIPAGENSNSTEVKFLPSATVSYQLNGGGNAYARYARGFKTGGVNPFNPPSDFASPQLGAVFGGETVDTYEVGFRAPFLDHRLDLTTAVFYNNYKNLQYQAHTNAAHSFILTAIVNGGSARTWGAEETLSWRVIQPLTLGVSAGYLNAKYKDFQITDTTVLVPINLSGQQMIDSPKTQLDITADLDQPLSNGLHLVGNFNVAYLSDILFTPSAVPGVLPNAEQSPYWLTNARLGVRTADSRYELAIEVNNLFDKAYITFGSSTQGQGTLGTWGEPRIVRGEFVARF